jgi:hypothetical protein
MFNRAETAIVEPWAGWIAHICEDCKGLKNSPGRLELCCERFRGFGPRWPTAQDQVSLLTNDLFVERGHLTLTKEQIPTCSVQ